MGNRKPEHRLEVCYYDEDGYLETKSSYPLTGKIAPIEVYAAATDLDAACEAVQKELSERAAFGWHGDGTVEAQALADILRAALAKARGE